MKQIGLAFKTWSIDNSDHFPMRVSVTDGGTMELSGNGTVFPHFQVLSNELSTPKILACPNDEKRTFAASFDTGFSDTNLSYFLGLDAIEDSGSSLLCGDRNLTIRPMPANRVVCLTTNVALGWTKEIHSQKGYVCFGDGSVNQYGTGLLSASSNRLAVP